MLPKKGIKSRKSDFLSGGRQGKCQGAARGWLSVALMGPHGGRVALAGVCRLERVKLLVSVCPLYVERYLCVR